VSSISTTASKVEIYQIKKKTGDTNYRYVTLSSRSIWTPVMFF